MQLVRVPKSNKNKKVWSMEEIQFIRDNFFRLTNPQIAQQLGLKLTIVRYQCHAMGLKRIELEYWTDEQVQYLRNNYENKGDIELAKIFESKWPKNKRWIKQHIEKKRKYLKLHRSPEQIKKIMLQHKANGVFVEGNKKMWVTRGAAADGEIRYWHNKDRREFPVIKMKGVWMHWNRWAWIMAHGSIPEDMNVVFKDGNQHNLSVKNLELLSNEDLGARNSQCRMNNYTDKFIAWTLSYRNPDLRKELLKHPALLDLKRQSLILKKAINEYVG